MSDERPVVRPDAAALRAAWAGVERQAPPIQFEPETGCPVVAELPQLGTPPEAIIGMFVRNAAQDIGGMTLATFYENKPEILAGVNALMAKSRSRKRFRLVAVYERGSGELLLEAFAVSRGPVVVYRTGSVYRDGDAEFVRQDRGGAAVAVAGLDNDPGQRFNLVSRRHSYAFFNRDVRRWIIDGRIDGTGRHAVTPPAG